jgi:YbbR domain-containing protein
MVSSFPIMVLALILATLAWVVAVEEEDPTVEERYPQVIPIPPPEPPEGMLIVGDFDERVQVTVRAPESVWRSLEVGDFTVTIDLTGLGTGKHHAPVQVILNKEPSQVTLVEPEYVTLELEPEAEQTVPVRIQVEGEPALGYVMRAAAVEPRQVMVSGPSTYVAQVVEAATQVSVQDADSDIEGGFFLRPLDSQGQPVPYVTLMPAEVAVHIPVEHSGYYRTLTVVPIREGEVAPGYRITYISVEPPSVTVFGSPDVIAALPSSIETEPIDVEGAKADMIVRPALNLTQTVSVVPGQQVEVRVFIEPIESSVTIELTPELQGLAPSFTATVSPATVEVILSGPLPLLEALEPGDVRVVLELFEQQPGTYQIKPQVIVPEGVTAQSVLPATVHVEILAVPTPTPTGTPVPTEG